MPSSTRRTLSASSSRPAGSRATEGHVTDGLSTAMFGTPAASSRRVTASQHHVPCHAPWTRTTVAGFAMRASCPEAAAHGQVPTDRDHAPGGECARLGGDRLDAYHQIPRHRAERSEPETAETRARSIDLGVHPAVLAFDQRQARREDRGKREEQARDPVAGTHPDDADDDRHDEAEREPQQQRVDVNVPQSRRLERDPFVSAVALQEHLAPTNGSGRLHQLIPRTTPNASAATRPHDTKASADPRSAPKRSTVTTAVAQYATIANDAKIIDSDCTRAACSPLSAIVTSNEAMAIEGAAPKMPAKLFGPGTSDSAANAATNVPPTRPLTSSIQRSSTFAVYPDVRRTQRIVHWPVDPQPDS